MKTETLFCWGSLNNYALIKFDLEMNKQEAIINLSTIFNRGLSSEAETNVFKDLKHDVTIKTLQTYIQDSHQLIGNPKLSFSQALNDHGVDLLVEFPNTTKIGIQVKSHYDLGENDFAMKVKAQLADSQVHGLDKWFLLICAPMNDGKRDYTAKISHLINEFSNFKTSYSAIYNPQQCTNIYTKGIMLQQEFNLIKNQFFSGEIDWHQILAEIYSEKKQKTQRGFLHLY